MKRYRNLFLSLILIFTFLFPTTVFAVGDGNIDGGGGSMGGGTITNVWSPGNDGVRVTIVRASDHAVVTTPIDITNRPPNSSIYNFGKVSKLQYSNGKSLAPQKGGYSCIKPTQAMPRIVSTNGSNNIDAIKSYFTDEQVIHSIANHTGMNYDILIGGDYKMLLEPLAFYKFEGVMIATTATEAAMYDEQISGGLSANVGQLTRKNLPLAMFLETADLGFPKWTGTTNGIVSNQEIQSSLGLGIVRFTEQPEPPIVTSYDYEYRVNTEVITAVTVSGGQSDPDNPTRVNFRINDKTYNVNNVYYPSGKSQIAWVKWKTPNTEQDMTIDVSANGSGSVEKSTMNVKIVDLNKNQPPNPVADDRNNSFTFTSVPNRPQKTRADWSVWRPWWKEHWVDEGHYKTHSHTDSNGKKHTHRTWVKKMVDRGWWEFDLDHYSASLSATMKIKTDNKNPTANGRTMKSGYGINQNVSALVSSNQSSAVTNPQNAVSYFPEFNYNTYWRLLERVQGGSYPRFEFQKNKYSTYKNRTHFSPIWIPDGIYIVNTWVTDCWTPVGMLSMNLTDSLTIRGNLWQDWHIAPLES